MKIPTDLDPNPPFEEFWPRTPPPPVKEFLDPPLVSYMSLISYILSLCPIGVYTCVSGKVRLVPTVLDTQFLSLGFSSTVNWQSFVRRPLGTRTGRQLHASTSFIVSYSKSACRERGYYEHPYHPSICEHSNVVETAEQMDTTGTHLFVSYISILTDHKGAIVYRFYISTNISLNFAIYQPRYIETGHLF